jgi:carbon-monoxide dehydrogenase iron sulfur subunit
MTLTATKGRVIVVDLGRCLACRSCETACAVAHSAFEDIVDAVLAGARLRPRVRVVAAEGTAVPIQCQHCEDAPCVAVCPSGALFRKEEGGPVLTAPERCIGCKSCVVVCPFGSLRWEGADGTVVKCDLCNEIIEEGETPRCVLACPTGARRVVAVEELAQQRMQEAARRTVRTVKIADESRDDSEGHGGGDAGR